MPRTGAVVEEEEGTGADRVIGGEMRMGGLIRVGADAEIGVRQERTECQDGDAATQSGRAPGSAAVPSGCPRTPEPECAPPVIEALAESLRR